MNSNRRQVLSVATLALASIYGGAASAQGYPNKPVKIIVPWAPGGSTDAIARALAQELSDRIKQAFVVDNRPGAAAQIGTDALAKSAPDGYTLGLVELPHAIAPAVVSKLPYDLLTDFAPITMLGTSPVVLFVSATLDVKDLKGFIEAAKKKASPAFAHSGSGSISHLAGEMFAKASKIKFNQVSYRGSAPALADVAAGVVDAHFATLASGAGLLSTGKIKAIAVAGSKRFTSTSLAAVPTFSEAGYKDFVVNQWWALVGPSTLPLELVEMLRRETTAAMASNKVTDRLTSLGVELKGSSKDELRSFMRSESNRWQALAKEIGLQPQ